jgi:hypothetical protein
LQALRAEKNEFWIVTALAAIGVLLAIVNMTLFSQNRAAQAEVTARAQYSSRRRSSSRCTAKWSRR